MIPIYICEDQPAILNKISQQVQQVCMIEALDFFVQGAVTQPQELLQLLAEESEVRQGIYFLDVDLSHETLDGFELGKRIRQLDGRGFIVYITTHGELLPETFKHRVEALDYILKDDAAVLDQRIHEALLTIQQRLLKQPPQVANMFTIESASRVLHVPLEEIQYFETTSKKHVVALISTSEYVEFHDSLNRLAADFSDTFFRTHQSYLVNLAWVKGIDKKRRVVVLRDGSTCLVARSKLKELQKITNLSKATE